MVQLNQDLTNYETQEGFDPLPAGWYPARVVDSEIRQGPKGAYINWTFGIVGHPNRVVWDVMSLGNEVSMRRLKTMASCCGHRNPNYIADTEELHGLECLVKLKIEHDEFGKYDDKNKISGFKPLPNDSARFAANAPAAKPAPAPTVPPPVGRKDPAGGPPPGAYYGSSENSGLPPAHVAEQAQAKNDGPAPKMPWEK